MKTIEQHIIFVVRMLALAFILTMTLPSTAQDIIRRKGNMPNRSSISRPVQKKKETTTKRISFNNLSDLFDSVAVSEVVVDSVADVPSSPKVTETMTVMTGSGFEMYGRSLLDYSDNAEGQKKVRESLSESKNAKTGCLTTHGAIYVYGGNGFISNGLKNEIYSALTYCNDNKHVINDISFTESGWWCVVYENNKYKGHIPEKLQKKLDQYASVNEIVTSVSISENGDHVIVTDKHIDASNDWDLKKIQQAIDKFGHVNSVSISNKGIIVSCIRGILFWDVPNKVIESLKKKNLSPRVVRFTDSGTYMAFGEDGKNAYFM